jgi:diguanylate cyclase (GGDEF)-like protein
MKPTAASDEPAKHSGARPVILIVDDDPIVRALLRDELEDNGFLVREADNGVTAVENCAELQPDLLVVDAIMPRMDGFELCQAVRDDPDTRHMPILMATGLHDVGSIERAFEAGATDFISKPLSWPIITQRIRYMLRTARTADDLRESQVRLHAAEAMRQTHARRFEAALDNMSQGLCMVGDDGGVIVTNRRFLDLYQLPPSAVVPGMPLVELMEASQLFGQPGNRRREPSLAAYLTLTRHPARDTLNQELSDGRVIAIAHEPMKDGGFVDTFTDITERRRTELRIAHMAMHDPLTDLPNRVLFRRQLEEALRGVSNGGKCAVLYVDLDRFKNVNDTLGHRIGDMLLKAVAGRLRAILRLNTTVARLGGDEFAIVQTALDTPADAVALAERVRQVLSEPFNVSGHQVTIGASIGIAVAPADSQDPDRLLQCADRALYEAKAGGRNRLHSYEAHMGDAMQFRLIIERDLANALAADEFELFYQPIVNLHRGRIIGFEALLRWNSPRHRSVSPGIFIPIAEESGHIEQIGEWVLHTACEQAARWPDKLKVAVNISAIQFRNGRLSEIVAAALRSSGLDPRRLELEITESILIEDFDATILQLRSLKSLGVSIAMDDFGTGYSSLSYLRSFPFDKLKIDQSFVRDLRQDSESTAIIRAVTGICASLNITATAEGVETPHQLAILIAEGCDEVQGYLVSKPQAAHLVPEMLRTFAREWNRMTTRHSSAPPFAASEAASAH